MDDANDPVKHDNELDGRAREVKNNYERLHRLATNSHPKEFEEPKAQGEIRVI